MSCIPEVLMLLQPLGMLQCIEGIWVPSFSEQPPPPLQPVTSAPCSPCNPFLASVVPKKVFQIQPSCQNVGYLIVCMLASVRTCRVRLPASPNAASLGSPVRLRCLLCSTKMLQHSPRGFLGLLHTERKLGAAVAKDTGGACSWLQFD